MYEVVHLHSALNVIFNFLKVQRDDIHLYLCLIIQFTEIFLKPFFWYLYVPAMGFIP